MNFATWPSKRPTSGATACGPQHVAHRLGIEPRRQRSRADQVGEHDRQLPARVTPRHRRLRGLLSRVYPVPRRLGVQCHDRFEQPLAVTKVKPELFQIGIGEVAQDVPNDAILGERLGMMAKPLFSEPAREVEHFGVKLLYSRYGPAGCVPRPARLLRRGTKRPD
jgi:hypothetical protein